MKIHDALFGFFFLALGALVLFAIRGFPNIPGQPVGPALFPGLIAVGLCVTGTLMVMKGLRSKAPTAWFAWEDWIQSPRHVLALCVLLACVVFYILAANQLGFLLYALYELCSSWPRVLSCDHGLCRRLK